MLSIIVPVMNEEGSLRQLWEEILTVAQTAVDRFEVIFYRRWIDGYFVADYF